MEVYSLMVFGVGYHISGLKGIFSSLQKAFEAAYYSEVEICAHGWRNGIPEIVWYHYGVFWDGFFKEDWNTFVDSFNINTAKPTYRIMAEQIDQHYPPPKYIAELQGYVMTLTLPAQEKIFSITEHKT